MTWQLSQAEVEAWLDANADHARDYFSRRADLAWVNAWLVAHGFLAADQLVNNCYRRDSGGSSGVESPSGHAGGESGGCSGDEREKIIIGSGIIPGLVIGTVNSGGESVSPSSPFNNGHHKRSNSKRCLRHDYARSKSRTVFRTHDIIIGNCICDNNSCSGSCCPNNIGLSGGNGSSICDYAAYGAGSRRSSLNDMRKYTSLPPSSFNMLRLLIESKIRLPACAPLAASRHAKRELLRCRGERDFFLACVRDVATELDLKSLTKHTVDNLAVLLDADGASLFLVDGPRGGRQTLVSKVFDVHSGAGQFLLPVGLSSAADNEIQVPWGVGVLGHVADTGETVNLQIACDDPRFDDQVDRVTGYHTDSLLCMPVRNAYDEIIAVAQVVNKNPDVDGGQFTSKDEKLFETYLQFVGIAITNAQLMEASRKEYDRNRNLLEVVHDLFEEQTSLEKVVVKIMQRAQRLLKCERASVLLLEEAATSDSAPAPTPSTPTLAAPSTPPPAAPRFSKHFELSPSGSSPKTKMGNGLRSLSDLNSDVFDFTSETPSVSTYVLSVARRVAEHGGVVNVAECLEVEKGIGNNVRSLLAMPIRDSAYRIIGVATIINKLTGTPFDETDEQLFEAFSLFCGLGIHNTLMYSQVEKSMARQKVAIEVLSYHTNASNREVESFLELSDQMPCADQLNLYSLTFDDFCLSDEEMVLAAVSMFVDLGLVKRFSIDRKTLYRFLLTIKRNYRDVPYHNWRHAFNVAQVMFAILMGCEMKGTFNDIEVLGMFVGCLCHDLDHRGTNNAFQQKAGSALVLLYGTTNTMEQHHFNHAVMILSSESHNIFSSLSSEHYSKVMTVLKHSILATDLSVYFQNRTNFFSLVESRRYSWGQTNHRRILRSMLMTASDLAASCKPWPVQERVARLVAQEFFSQGDIERVELKLQPQAPMDRERQHELPQLQIRWITDICLPLYKSLGQMNPKLSIMAEGALENVAHWANLVQEEMQGEVEEMQVPCDQGEVEQEDDD